MSQPMWLLASVARLSRQLLFLAALSGGQTIDTFLKYIRYAVRPRFWPSWCLITTAFRWIAW
jgi:hypothetical protein